MTLTDEELDRDWKPNGRRPQSTIARSFSLELMDIFRIENSVADLDEQVVKRKQNVVHQTTELEALEARLREMEAMLKKNASLAAGSGGSETGGAAAAPAASSRHARGSLNGVFADPDADAAAQENAAGVAPRPLEHRPSQAAKYAGSRPGTARASQQAVPGALPPTPVGSEGESEGGDGDAEHD